MIVFKYAIIRDKGNKSAVQTLRVAFSRCSFIRMPLSNSATFVLPFPVAFYFKVFTQRIYSLCTHAI